jgi:hypothetical protein
MLKNRKLFWVSFTVKILGLDIILSIIFNYRYRMIRYVISFWVMKIDIKFRHVEFRHSNSAATLVVKYIKVAEK